MTNCNELGLEPVDRRELGRGLCRRNEECSETGDRALHVDALLTLPTEEQSSVSLSSSSARSCDSTLKLTLLSSVERTLVSSSSDILLDLRLDLLDFLGSACGIVLEGVGWGRPYPANGEKKLLRRCCLAGGSSSDSNLRSSNSSTSFISPKNWQRAILTPVAEMVLVARARSLKSLNISGFFNSILNLV